MPCMLSAEGLGALSPPRLAHCSSCFACCVCMCYTHALKLLPLLACLCFHEAVGALSPPSLHTPLVLTLAACVCYAYCACMKLLLAAAVHERVTAKCAVYVGMAAPLARRCTMSATSSSVAPLWLRLFGAPLRLRLFGCASSAEPSLCSLAAVIHSGGACSPLMRWLS